VIAGPRTCAATRHRKQHRIPRARQRLGRVRIDLPDGVHELREESEREAAARAAHRAPRDGSAWERLGRLRLRLMDRSGAIAALEQARLSREERAAAMAQESDRLKTALLSSVSHDLRTPIAGIKAARDRYRDGDLRARDAAYHQGTVWAWLIGPFIDAWLKVHPDDRAGGRALLQGLVAHLDEAGIGSVSEIFDAEAPFTPRGCVAQAWGVAELLRCWIKTG